MIIASDVTTLKERGKYNGFIGASVALGNGIGPVIGGAVTERASWQWCLWFIVPFIVCVMMLLALVIPKSTVSGNIWTKLSMIDWAGLFVSIAAVVLLLVSFQNLYNFKRCSATYRKSVLCPLLIKFDRCRSPLVVQLSHGRARWSSPCLQLAAY